ncbi:MAG: site-2 protease family protein [Phycisphaeraceae bacterium]
MDHLFIQNLFGDDGYGRFFYMSWIACIVVSIVLHELGRGWMALRLGDPTPNIQGRMTFSPLIHMGPLSIVVMLVTGIAWGSMPIDPTRMKGRFAEAKVAAAGPAVNIILAIIALLAAATWLRVTGDLPEENTPAKNGFDLLWLLASTNVVLTIFNLIPVPPLDGSHILANFSRGYADLLNSDGMRAAGWLPFIVVFVLMSFLFAPIMGIVLEAISQLGGVPLEMAEG